MLHQHNVRIHKLYAHNSASVVTEMDPGKLSNGSVLVNMVAACCLGSGERDEPAFFGYRLELQQARNSDTRAGTFI